MTKIRQVVKTSEGAAEAPPLTEDRRPKDREETPEEQAARLQRLREKSEMTRFLLENLFGYVRANFSTEGKAVRMIDRNGAAYTEMARGWFVTDPKTGEEFRYQGDFTAEVGASRAVVEAMNAKGYGFASFKTPGADWEGVFIATDYDRPAYRQTAPDEAMAVCKAARSALLDEIRRAGA